MAGKVRLWLHFLRKTNLGWNLGRSSGRKVRPALSFGEYRKEVETVVFLTSKLRDDRPCIDVIKNCFFSDCSRFHWKKRACLYEEGKGRRFILLPSFFLEMSKAFKLCGVCSPENLDDIKRWVFENEPEDIE